MESLIVNVFFCILAHPICLLSLLFVLHFFGRLTVSSKRLLLLQRNTFFLHLVENVGFTFSARSMHSLLVEQGFFVHLICFKLYICNF